MTALPWSRFVALGDSLSEGVGDPVGGSLRGWADRLATTLKALNPDLEYSNLAKRSLLTSEVREEQLDRALELEPDLVTLVSGMNDLMSKDFDRDSYKNEMAAIVDPLAGKESTIVLGTLPPDLPLLRLMPRSKGAGFRRRLHEVSDVVRELATEYESVLVDAPKGWRYTMSECSIDGCHPNARGHVHIAQLAIEALCDKAGIPAVSIEREGCGWLHTSAGHLRWILAQGYLRKAPEMLLKLRQSGAMAPPSVEFAPPPAADRIPRR